MGLSSVIRRWHLHNGIPIREIARRTGLSRNTVRKYLANQVTEPAYTPRQSPSKLGDYADTLTSWLFREPCRHRNQRLTVKQLYRDLIVLGCTVSYDRVAAFSRQWRQVQQEAGSRAGKQAHVPLHFAPGEAFQFDWSEGWVRINGISTKLQIAHFKLSYSRAFFMQVYLIQTHEMLFDAHYHAFKVFGGIPQRGIYDNMEIVGSESSARVNALFILSEPIWNVCSWTKRERGACESTPGITSAYCLEAVIGVSGG